MNKRIILKLIYDAVEIYVGYPQDGAICPADFRILLVFLPVMVLQALNQLVECHGDGAQDNDRGNYHA